MEGRRNARAGAAIGGHPTRLEGPGARAGATGAARADTPTDARRARPRRRWITGGVRRQSAIDAVPGLANRPRPAGRGPGHCLATVVGPRPTALGTERNRILGDARRWGW